MDHNQSVFINCPFGVPEYELRLKAIIFTIHYCGYFARCALETSDSGQIRLQKIFEIIEQCKYGIHDISYVGLDPASNLPRFNMPFELGLFLGANQFGSGSPSNKVTLILDRDQYRYQVFCSDIAGQDIAAHNDSAEVAVGCVRRWLRNQTESQNIPGETTIWLEYLRFNAALPHIAAARGIDLHNDDVQFTDLRCFITEWLLALSELKGG